MDDNPSEKVLERKLAILSNIFKDFEEVHSMVLESVQLEGGDVDNEGDVDTEIYDIFTAAVNIS